MFLHKNIYQTAYNDDTFTVHNIYDKTNEIDDVLIIINRNIEVPSFIVADKI